MPRDLITNRKLAASVAFNLVAKLPSIAAVLIVLPRINRALGPHLYSNFIAALALGSVTTLPFGGINAVGKRLLASAAGDHNRPAQADAYVSTLTLMTLCFLAATLAAAFASARHWNQDGLLIVCMVPVVAGMLNTFDNLRAAYNEHYATALYQLIFQVLIYTFVYVAGLPHGATVSSALAIQGPFALASIVTGLTLTIQRPYLLTGTTSNLRHMLLPSLLIVLADGALLALLNVTVYALNLSDATDLAAWVGTFARLFQSLLSPALLILFPLTSYMSMRWRGMPQTAQRRAVKLFACCGLGYGLVVGLIMAILGPAYLNRMFTLATHGSTFDLMAICLFMGAVVAQKAYTMFAYSISESRFISFATTAVTALAIAVAGALCTVLTPMQAADALFVVAGTALPIVLLVDALRRLRNH